MDLFTRFRVRIEFVSGVIEPYYTNLMEMMKLNFAEHIQHFKRVVSVDPFVGLDMDDQVLYENDIIKTQYNDIYDHAYYQIVWDDDKSAFWLKCIALHHVKHGYKDISRGGYCEHYFNNKEGFLIGNAYDNPELNLKSGNPEYALIEKVSRALGMQDQYVSYYIHGTGSYKKLSDGLRIIDDIGNCHAIKIHKDDVDELVRRIQQERDG